MHLTFTPIPSKFLYFSFVFLISSLHLIILCQIPFPSFCTNFKWHSWIDRQGTTQKWNGSMDDGRPLHMPWLWRAALLWALAPIKRYDVARRCQLNIHVMFAKELTSSSSKSENNYVIFFCIICIPCNSWNAYSPVVYSVLRIPALHSNQGTSYFRCVLPFTL